MTIQLINSFNIISISSHDVVVILCYHGNKNNETTILIIMHV